jgi:ParB-like chromosome segregation protein Spo0J
LKDLKLKIEYWPIERLLPYARNPRKNDEAVDRGASFIKEFGFSVPVLVQSDGTIIDGHLRLKCAKRLGMKEIPVTVRDDMTDVQIKAFRLSVNRFSELADWDDDLLKLELMELDNLQYDVDLLGFNIEPEDVFEPNLSDNENNDKKISFKLIIDFKSEDEQILMFDELKKRGLSVKAG